MTAAGRRRVAVTRPAEQAAELVVALEAIGVDVVVVPLTRIIPIEHSPQIAAAMADLDRYDDVIVTSANGARCLGAALRTADRVVPVGATVVAVGAATAEVLRAEGIPVDLVPELATSAGILAALPQADLAGRRVLLPRARIGRPELPAGLRARGMIVDDVAFYDTESMAPDAAQVEALLSADLVIVTAPSAVATLAAVTGERARRMQVVTIGPTTSAAVRDIGATVAAESMTQSVEGLAAAVRALSG